MEQKDIARIERLAESRGRYRAEAYFWVLRVLEFAHARLRKEGHVTGRELLEGTRLLALEEYGPMALEVFHHWGLRATEDIGRVVFDLIEEGLLSKTEEDSLEDFSEVYDFEQVFVREAQW
jgi:uncharacterized repeat protein (TIGR04138 family)